MSGRRFIDTNVIVHLLSSDPIKADRAEAVVAGGGVVSVQVLNEFASVGLRKAGLSVAEVREVLAAVRAACRVVAVGEAVHDRGLDLVERRRFSFWDAMIVAAALEAGCDELVSEDMQYGRVIDGLTIRNPFRDGA